MSDIEFEDLISWEVDYEYFLKLAISYIS